MSLNASIFKFSKLYSSRQFEFILGKVGVCCNRMADRDEYLENNENVLRNVLHKDYLNNNIVREELNLIPFIFTIESPEINKNYHESGRHDIRILNSSEYCSNTSLYYVIECKRLDGYASIKGSLNWKYIHEGLKRFVTRDDYPSIYGKSGMLGFIIKKLNISDLVGILNEILRTEHNNIPTSQYLTKSENIPATDNAYLSIHQDINKRDILLYHILVDLSSKVLNN